MMRAPCGSALVPALLTLLVLLSPASARATEPAAPETIEKMPGGTQESVTALLAKTGRDYGEDAVLIQTQLLLNVLRNGSQLAAGARVAGVDEHDGNDYLRFHLETGLVFDDRTRDLDDRVHMLWLTIVEPVLESIGEPDLRQSGVAIETQSFHRPYSSARELRATIDEPGTSEDITFWVRRTDLAALARTELAVRDMFARARITVDDRERSIAPPPEDASRLAGPP